MKRLLSLVTACVVIGGILPGTADAAQRRYERDRGWDRGHFARDDYRRDRYFRDRDIVVIREYYRPTARRLPPGLAKKYARTGYLPPGWARRVQPIPVYIERDMLRIPRGYRRGIIDGRAVVYDNRGFILDVAVLF